MADLLCVHNGETEIIRIREDGRIFWRGREVETDEQFRAAVMDTVTAFRLAVNNDAQRARMN